MSNPPVEPTLETVVDPSDPYVRAAQTFPTLSDNMVQRISRFGSEEEVADGGYLFRRGERSVDFFLVLEGAIDILEHHGDGSDHVVHRHGAKQFTGELDLFNDRQILVSGRADGPTRVVRVKRADFRVMMAAEADIGEIIMRAFILRRVGLLRHEQGGITLVGPRRSSDMARLDAFLTRNGYPHRLIDTEVEAETDTLLTGFGLTHADLPVVVTEAEVLRNPATHDLADHLGLTVPLDADRTHDVIVVGAGPAGLAAAVYAASEGLDTLVIESTAPGGQAGTSSKIENYLGFPTGISGQALAGRAQVQAQKFGARLAVSRAAVSIDCQKRPFRIGLEDGTEARGWAVIAATGARYRKLALDDYERFEGAGIHYAATAMEAKLCENVPVVVVGGGNSAGQAAMFLSKIAAHVHMIVRGEGLAASMSRYLIERIEASERITMHTHTALSGLTGGASLERVAWTNSRTGKVTEEPVRAVFVMIGAEPNTEWLSGCIDLDERGFARTGSDRSPFETSQAGLFAVGDVRSGSVKRVASGVGEGSVVVQAVHAAVAAGQS